MKYAELFSGIGTGSLAVNNVFPGSKCVFHSEISPQRIKIHDKHFSDVKNIGDINFVDEEDMNKLPDFDLLIGGSPCQDLSIARGKGREGLDGEQSGLFYKFLDLYRIKKPRFFMLENVASMPDDERNEISRCLKVEPVEISSIHFTGQDRRRYYWANFPVPKANHLPKLNGSAIIDRSDEPTLSLGQVLWKKDIGGMDGEDWKLLHSVWHEGEKKGKAFIRKHKSDWEMVGWSRSTRELFFNSVEEMNKLIKLKELMIYKCHGLAKNKKDELRERLTYVEQRIKINMGANTLVTGKHCARMSSKNLVRNGSKYRQLSVKECLRLQGLPDDWLNSMSELAAFAAIGDGFTRNVIEHNLEGLRSIL